ncbi:hypothetical protein REPUB_Repub20aG0139000 [Reevesia pubescens]
MSWWGCVLPRVSCSQYLLFWSLNAFHLEKFQICWHVAFSALLYSLWTYRNKVLFERALWDVDAIFQGIVRSSFSWASANLKEFSSLLFEWAVSPRKSIG